MTANPRIPTFTLASVGIGHWAIGGFSPKYRPIGSDLAKEALSILEKKIAPKDIHPQIIPNVNPAKRNVMVVKNEMRLLKQKRNVLQI